MRAHRYIYSLLLTIFLSIIGSEDGRCQAPDWSIDVGSFQYSMTVVAQVLMDLNPVSSTGHLLGAFVDDELHGISSPVIAQGSAYYFLTIYSNNPSGDQVMFKIYLENEDQIYQAVDSLTFGGNENVGSIYDPFHINISNTGDYPIAIFPFHPDTTLVGIPFDTLDLTEHLYSLDGDPVTWTVLENMHWSIHLLPGHRLWIEPVDTGWVGTDSIWIVAAEEGTILEHADTQVFVVTIIPNYIGPGFLMVPPQYSNAIASFPVGELNSFLISESNCLNFKVELLPIKNDIPDPDWNPPPPGSSPMHFIIRLLYNDIPYIADGTLAGFINGVLAGTANPTIDGNSILFYLTLADVEEGWVDLQFYDTAGQHVHFVKSIFPFIANANAGTPENPFPVDIAPILIIVDDEDRWNVTTIDSSFEGIQVARFIAFDCAYESKSDTMEVLFLHSICTDTIEICPGQVICASTLSNLNKVIWFLDSKAIFNHMDLAIEKTGEYQYLGLSTENQIMISCKLFVQEGSDCVGEFQETHHQRTFYAFPPSDGMGF